MRSTEDRLSPDINAFVTKESGILFSGIQHDANIQQSDEEVERVKAIHVEMLGRLYTAKDGSIRTLGLNDFLFIAPYNAQVPRSSESPAKWRTGR